MSDWTLSSDTECKLVREETGDEFYFAAHRNFPGAWATGDTPETALDKLADVIRGWVAISKATDDV